MAKKEPPLTIRMTGYGHWKITTTYYGKPISTTTTDSIAIDNYNSDNDKRKKHGYNSLRQEIINANKG